MINPNSEEVFIKKNFKIKYCSKFIEKENGLCNYGKLEAGYEILLNNDSASSIVDNLNEKPCDTFGSIIFEGYENPRINVDTKFIRFYCQDQSEIEKNAYKLLTGFWNSTPPRLIISVNGGLKRMNFRMNQQKKNFKQGLIEVMKKDTTWIIGGGFNVGIHKLIGEAVYDYRLLHDGNENQVKLIGICTWGVVQNNDSLSNGKSKYTYSIKTEKGKVALDPNYDCFFFCDDGTERQYDKEIDFRLNFEKYVQDEAQAFPVQILYEGGKRALEYAYNLLTKRVPLVVIKSSGRAADIICDVFNLKEPNCKENIFKILSPFKSQCKLSESNFDKYQKYLYDIHSNYKTQIVVHDILDPNMKFEKNILKAVISRDKMENFEKILQLTIRFDCYDIAEAEVFQDPRFFSLTQEELMKHFKDILKMNRFEFVELFLENITKIEESLTVDVFVDLYKASLSLDNCRCIELLLDLIKMEDKSFRKDEMSQKSLSVIYKIIHMLTNNILKQKFIEKDTNKSNVNLTIRDLYLWALLCGHFEMALIFWRVGKDHIGSALIGSIILNKMKTFISKRGFSDLSETLSLMSRKYQDLAITIINEAYNKDQLKTCFLLNRVLSGWDQTTCLQLAVTGNLLDFLNQSPCRSHTREAWMGELSPFLPTWKVLLTIPFSVILIKPFIIPSFAQKKSRKNSESEVSLKSVLLLPLTKQYSVECKLKNVTFREAIKKFYQTPIVKFIIYLLTYVLFLLVFAYLNLVELKEIQSENKIRAEIFVYIYITAISMEEIRQINDYEKPGILRKLKHYMSGSWNIYDIFVILLFFTSVILRFTLPNNYFTIVRCFFAVTFSMFCLRSMQFYFIIPSIGPKVIMIRKMIVDILFFLSIFSLFLISYGTLAQSLLNPNSEWNLYLIKGVFYNPYFQTYGELMLDAFNITSPCEQMCTLKYATIIGAFAVFLLLTNILLINLLIAMFGHTFNKIQGESEKHFSFIQIQLLSEFQRKPSIPPPVNILYFISVMIKLVFSKIIRKQEKRKNDCMMKDLSENENIKLLGFEQLCMESSVLKVQNVKNFKKESQPQLSWETVMQLIDKLKDVIDFKESLKYWEKYRDKASNLPKVSSTNIPYFNKTWPHIINHTPPKLGFVKMGLRSWNDRQILQIYTPLKIFSWF